MLNKPKTVDAILSQFSKTIDALNEVAKRNSARADQCIEEINRLDNERAECAMEASHAEHVAAKIRTLIE